MRRWLRNRYVRWKYRAKNAFFKYWMKDSVRAKTPLNLYRWMEQFFKIDHPYDECACGWSRIEHLRNPALPGLAGFSLYKRYKGRLSVEKAELHFRLTRPEFYRERKS